MQEKSNKIFAIACQWKGEGGIKKREKTPVLHWPPLVMAFKCATTIELLNCRDQTILEQTVHQNITNTDRELALAVSSNVSRVSLLMMQGEV